MTFKLDILEREWPARGDAEGFPGVLSKLNADVVAIQETQASAG